MSAWRAPFARFAAAGAIGFCIDAGVLSLLVHTTPVSPAHARLVSMTLAISATWLINRRFTFKPRSAVPGHVEYAGYFAIQCLGVAINYGIFTVCLRAWPWLVAIPVLPAAAGSVSAMLFNFAAARRVLYTHDHR